MVCEKWPDLRYKNVHNMLTHQPCLFAQSVWRRMKAAQKKDELIQHHCTILTYLSTPFQNSILSGDEGIYFHLDKIIKDYIFSVQLYL